MDIIKIECSLVAQKTTAAHRKAIRQVSAARQNAGKTFILEEMADIANEKALEIQPKKKPDPQIGL